MRVGTLLKVVGGLLVIMGLMVSVPGWYDLINDGPLVRTFFHSAAVALALGLLLWISQKGNTEEPNNRTGFAIVTASWFSACLVGALPYYLSGTLPSFLNAFFESTSGFTGTGASVLTDIEACPNSLLLWRSMTQWLGGMGIIVFFIAILPLLGLGGTQLFKAEVTGPSKDKMTPRVRETAKKLWLLYFIFTIALTALLIPAGMTPFDAFNHAMTTLSTGGFSTKNAGLRHYDSVAIDYLIITFMTIGSINFGLHYLVITRRKLSELLTTEFVWYFTFVALATLVMTMAVWNVNHEELSDAFRASLFSVMATASSTGFTNYDYALWPIGVQAIIVMLMIMGGMSGSTAGGLKCIRVVAAIKLLAKELKQVIHPHAVLTVKADRHSLAENVTSAIWGFIFLYLTVMAFTTIVLCFNGLDLISSFTAVISALSNIGPALGTLGPTSNFAEVNEISKLLLCACMVMGRLEFYTVIVVFTVSYWKK